MSYAKIIDISDELHLRRMMTCVIADVSREKPSGNGYDLNNFNHFLSFDSEKWGGGMKKSRFPHSPVICYRPDRLCVGGSSEKRVHNAVSLQWYVVASTW